MCVRAGMYMCVHVCECGYVRMSTGVYGGQRGWIPWNSSYRLQAGN